MIEYGISKGYEKHHQLLKYKIDLSRKNGALVIPSCVLAFTSVSLKVFLPQCVKMFFSGFSSQSVSLI